MKSIISLVQVLAVLLPLHSLQAWDNHFYGTSIALSEIQQIKNAPPVKAETLEDFLTSLASTSEGFKELSALLDEMENWARQNIAHYSPLPPQLQLRASTDPQELRKNFLHAIRVNPNAKLALFVQLLPGEKLSHSKRLSPNDFTLLPNSIHVHQHFLRLKKGQTTSLLSIISTASDEPDYGLDVGLWEDNGTSFGEIYGFGKQPFGNPRLKYSSQAPFHMSFFFEGKIIEAAAPFIKKTYPEYRFNLFRRLSLFAFERGKPYWGARFAGWALHYLQDLTQPYRSTLMPGAGTLKMLFVNGMDLLGFPRIKTDAIQLLTNGHLALENYGYYFLSDAISQSQSDELSTLRQSEELAPFIPTNYLREVVAKESHELASRTQETLNSSLPPQMISDPRYYFGETDPDVNAFSILEKEPVSAQQNMRELFKTLLGNFGKHSRKFFQTLLINES